MDEYYKNKQALALAALLASDIRRVTDSSADLSQALFCPSFVKYCPSSAKQLSAQESTSCLTYQLGKSSHQVLKDG